MMLNGAVTLGTEDGANVEIHELVGEENFFVFGATSQEVIEHYKKGDYHPREIYNRTADIRQVVDFITSAQMIATGNKESLMRLQSELMNKDWFMTFLDFETYCDAKEAIYRAYEDENLWAKMALVNIAKAGFFSADRTISQYQEDIWKL